MLGNPQAIKKVEHFVKPATKEFICEPCKKSFKTQNSYKSHLRLSKVHQYSKKIDKVDIAHKQVPQGEKVKEEPIKGGLENKEANELIEQISHLSSADVIKLFNELYNEKQSEKDKKKIEKEKLKAEKAIKKAELEKEKEAKRKLKMEAYAEYKNLLQNDKVKALLKGINNIPKESIPQVARNSGQSKESIPQVARNSGQSKESIPQVAKPQVAKPQVNSTQQEKVILAPPDKKVLTKPQPSLKKENGTTYITVKDENDEAKEVENLDDRLFKSKKKKKYKQNEINILTGLPVKPKTRVNKSGVIEQYYE